jgi:hypothetical protein
VSSKKHNGAVRSRKNCTETAQTKLGKTHVDYWAARLEKRTFVGRDGVRVEIPDYQIRMQHRGRSAYFNLKSANATEAAVKARDIYVFLIANGWEATLSKHKPKPAKNRNGLTIDGFSDHFREARKTVEDPPLKRTGERYIKSLHYIGRTVGVDEMSLLNAGKIKEFKAEYFRAGRAEKRDENSIKISGL